MRRHSNLYVLHNLFIIDFDFKRSLEFRSSSLLLDFKLLPLLEVAFPPGAVPFIPALKPIPLVPFKAHVPFVLQVQFEVSEHFLHHGGPLSLFAEVGVLPLLHPLQFFELPLHQRIRFPLQRLVVVYLLEILVFFCLLA